MLGKRISFGITGEEQTNPKRGKFALPIGSPSYTINFGTNLMNNDYILATSLVNNVDNPVSVYSYIITNTTISGFDIQFSGTIDSNNFVVHWIVIL